MSFLEIRGYILETETEVRGRVREGKQEEKMSPTGRAIEHCLSPLIPESQLPFRERGKREREREERELEARDAGEGCSRSCA